MRLHTFKENWSYKHMHKKLLSEIWASNKLRQSLSYVFNRKYMLVVYFNISSQLLCKATVFKKLCNYVKCILVRSFIVYSEFVLKFKDVFKKKFSLA